MSSLIMKHSKLARLCLALQEVDLHIHYCPGKKNANVDALSHDPQMTSEEGLIADSIQSYFEKRGENPCTATARWSWAIIDFLESGTLP